MTMINEPLLIPRMKLDDLDFILFDMEHGRYDCQDLLPMLAMCRINKIPSIVRVQDSLYHLIAKTVDMGADGIMLPRVETIEQLQIAVDAIRFYPVGKKGCGGALQFRPGESFEQFQSGRLLLLQIESPVGIQNLPEMIRKFKDQISGIIIGPYDLSVMLGTPLDISSDQMQKAIKQIFSICRDMKISSGCFCENPDMAKLYHSLGANIIWFGTDVLHFISGLNKMLGEIKELG